MSAGYSGTPLIRKLAIREGDRVGLVGAPATFAAMLGELPDGSRMARLRAGSTYDVIVAFFRARRALERRLPEILSSLDRAGGLWIAWPKRSSAVESDVSEGVVRELGLRAGVVDNKVCAIDETWSALRFVIRLRDR
jgi:hypothetical protein